MYYALLPDGQLLFGSELKSLLAHGGLQREIDPYAVEEYFALGYVPEPRTIFLGAHKLPPAATLTIQRGKPLPAPVSYWDVAFTLDRRIGEEEAKEELVRRLRESVKLRMISEVPLGAFLSGGVDSSAVVATMAGLSDSPVKTCSISFSDPAFDESAYAREVAERYHTNHFVEQVDADDFALIDQLVGLYDEPYADSSALPTYRVCELARKHVTVALSGDGGDENFGGYRRYRLHMNERSTCATTCRWVCVVRSSACSGRSIRRPTGHRVPCARRARSRRSARDSVQAYFHGVSILRDGMRQRLFSNTFKARLAGYNAVEVFRQHAATANTDDPLGLVQYLDLKTYLVGDINTKVDRASMAHSLEVREPLMDHPLVEWLASLPSNLKVRDGEGKWLFKKSMEPHLSQDILYRKKMGFSVPLARWFRGPLRERVRSSVLEGALAETGYFDMKYLRELVQDHTSGVRDYSAPLWTLLMFEGFLRSHGVGSAELPAMAAGVAAPRP